MKKNMGTIDRVARIAFAILIAVLIFTGVITGAVSIVLGIMAVIFLVTSALSFCPLYLPFKINTGVKEE